MANPTDLETTASKTEDTRLQVLSEKIAQPGFDPADPTQKADLQEYLYHLIGGAGVQYLTQGGDAGREQVKEYILENAGSNANKLAPYIEDVLQGFQNGKVAIQNESARANQPTIADPVVLYNGQFAHEHVDVTIHGAGIDFVFQRFYKNQVLYNGPLGANWTHSYNLYVREVRQQLILADVDFADKTFTRHPLAPQAAFDYFVPPDGMHACFVPNTTTNSFDLIHPDGRIIAFEPDPFSTVGNGHRLKEIRDRFGNYLAFTYGAVDGLLQKILVNSPVRIIQLQYDSARRLRELRDYTNRRWTYCYSDFNDLIAVIGPATAEYPAGLTTRYEYSSPTVSERLSHNMLRILDPAGQCYLENEYGPNRDSQSFNKVVRQRMGSQGWVRFEYEIVIPDQDFQYTEANTPFYQTNYFDARNHPVHFVHNRSGNLLLREEQILDNGSIVLLQTHCRYNADGQLIALMTPSGILNQSLFGRDAFLRQHNVKDADTFTDPNLDLPTRLSFGNLLGTVRRKSRLAFSAMNFNQGIWGDVFPDIIGAIDPADIISKHTYEPKYNQPTSHSDPRYTTKADPNGMEPPTYAQTLTTLSYQGPATDPTLLLHRITYPAATQADGSITPSSVQEFTHYDANGRLLRQIEPNGAVTLLEYINNTDPLREGYLKRTTVDAGALNLITRYEPDTLGRVVKTIAPRSINTGPGSFETVATYNELDQLIERVSPAPFFYKKRLLYDRNAKLRQTERPATDAAGANLPDGPELHTFSYDDQLNLTRETFGGADLSKHLVTQHTYVQDSKPYVTVLPNGNRIKREYDERGLEVALIKGFYPGDTYRTEHDADGLKSRMTTPKGHATQIAHDVFGNVVCQTDPLGTETRSTFDKNNNLLVQRVFERRNNQWFLLSRSANTYDERNRRITQTVDLFDLPPQSANPAQDFLQGVPGSTSLTTKFFFDPKGQILRTIDAQGRITQQTFDGAGRLQQLIDPAGNLTEHRWDEHGNLVRIDETSASAPPQVFTQTFAYDELDRRITEGTSLGNQRQHTYDSRNNRVRTVDALGNIQDDDFDIFNRRIRSRHERTDTGLGGGTRLADAIVQYDYDPNGNLKVLTEPRGDQTRFLYDDQDRPITIEYSNHSTQETAYDSDSHVDKTRDPNGLVTKFQTDPLGRVTKAQVDTTGLNPPFSVEGASLSTWTYDGAGRCTLSKNDFCSCETQYDSLHRPIQDTHILSSPLSDTAQSHIVSRTFYPSSTLDTLTYPSNRVVQFLRDPLDQLIEIDHQSLGNAYPGKAALPADKVICTFDYQGKRRRRALGGNGAQIVYSRDKEGKVIETRHQDGGGQTFLNLQQLYDAAGRVRFKNDLTPAASHAEDYKYDSEYQLTSLSPIANRAAFLSLTFGPYAAKPPDPVPNAQGAIDAVIGSLSQLAGPATWQYDLSGNRTIEQKGAQPPQPFFSNPLNQLTNARGRVATYDLNGNLIQLGTRRCVYDYQNRLVRVSDPAFAQDLVYLHDANGRRVLEQTQNAVRRLYYNGTDLIEEYENGALLCQYVEDDLPDHRVHIAAKGEDGWFHSDLTGSIRAITDRAGNVVARYSYDPFGVPNQVNGFPGNRLMFAGKRKDDDSESYDFQARQYDPNLGRFQQRDPLGWKDSVNLYVYAGNDPLVFVDPFGTERLNANFRQSVFESRLHLGELADHLNPFRNWVPHTAPTLEETYIQMQDPAYVEKAKSLEYAHAHIYDKILDKGLGGRENPFGGARLMTEFALEMTLNIAAGEVFALPFNMGLKGLSFVGRGIRAGLSRARGLSSAAGRDLIRAMWQRRILVRKTVPVEELHFIRNSGMVGRPGARSYFTLPGDMEGLSGFEAVSERLTLKYPGSTFRDTAVELELRIPNRGWDVGEGTQGGLGWTEGGLEGGVMDLTNEAQPATLIQRFRIHHPGRTSGWITGNPFQ